MGQSVGGTNIQSLQPPTAQSPATPEGPAHCHFVLSLLFNHVQSLYRPYICASATASQLKNATAFSFAQIGFFHAAIFPMCFSKTLLFLPTNTNLLSGCICLSTLLKNVLFASNFLVIEKKKLK